MMIGLAVGIDYALFIVSRYRELLQEGHDLPEAAGRATATAGSAVVFAGATVVIALLGLSVARIPFLTVMGVGSAFAVVVAVAIALTLLPAMLASAGIGFGRPPRGRSSSRWRVGGPGSSAFTLAGHGRGHAPAGALRTSGDGSATGAARRR